MKKLLKFIGGFINRKTCFLGLTVALAVFILPEVAQAVDPGDPTAQQQIEQELAFMVSLVIQALNTFLWPFLLVVGELMDNDLITGPGMEDRLLGIWVEIRNLVNIVFAVVLLVIAFYNALPISSSEGNLALKTALPKVVIGLILVNFTFLAGKVVLDVTNVATTAAFALPELVDDFSFEDQETQFSENVCMKPDKTLWKEADADNIPINTKLFCKFDEGTGDYGPELSEFIANNYFQDLNVNNVSIVMAVNMGGIESLGLLKPEAITSFKDLVINGLFSLVMYVIFAITFVVLGIVLLTRIVVMWVALALSPIAVLFYVVPQLKDAVGSGGGDIVGKITKQLLAPVIIGITMSIGFLMMAALSDVGGSFHEFANVQADDLLTSDFLISGISDMERFIIAIATVVIVWTGVFAAAEGTVSSFATDAIKGFGERAGGAIAKAPFLIPTVPIFTKDGKSPGVSPLALLSLADTKLKSFQFNETQRQLQGANINTGGLTKPAEILSSEIKSATSGNKISHGQLKGIATDLFKTVNIEDEGTRTKVTGLLQQINTSQDGAQAQALLKDVITNTSNAKELGINTSAYEALRTLAHSGEVTKAAAPVATDTVTPTGTPTAPTKVIVEGVDLDLRGSTSKAVLDSKKQSELKIGQTSEEVKGLIPELTKEQAEEVASQLVNESPAAPPA